MENLYTARPGEGLHGRSPRRSRAVELTRRTGRERSSPTPRWIRTEELFDLRQTIASPLLVHCSYPWEILEDLGKFIRQLGGSLSQEEYDCRGDGIWIAKTARVDPTVSIAGPCIIGPDAELRHCAFIRGNAIVGEGAVVGNSTEVKNAVLFNGVQAPHFNYLGDSVLGHRAHLGAGAVTSNLKSDRTPVYIRWEGNRTPTGRHKLGAFLGDRVEVGCNSVLCPGTVIGRDSRVYPASRVRGVIPQGMIYKGEGEIFPIQGLDSGR